MEKKYSVIIVIAVLAIVGFLRFGLPDPVRDDLKALQNENYAALTANYQAINAEVQNWTTYKQPIQYQRGVNNIIIPKVEDSMAILNNTQLTTPEVIALKQQHVDSLELFRKGAETAIEGINKNDEKKLKKAISYFEQAEAGMTAFNTNLEALAKEHGMKVIKE